VKLRYGTWNPDKVAEHLARELIVRSDSAQIPEPIAMPVSVAEWLPEGELEDAA